jgi:hypothetical protein
MGKDDIEKLGREAKKQMGCILMVGWATWTREDGVQPFAHVGEVGGEEVEVNHDMTLKA